MSIRRVAPAPEPKVQHTILRDGWLLNHYRTAGEIVKLVSKTADTLIKSGQVELKSATAGRIAADAARKGASDIEAARVAAE